MKVFVILLCLLNFFFASGKEIVSLNDLGEYLSVNRNDKVIFIKNGIYKDVHLNLSRLSNVKILAQTSGAVIIEGQSDIVINNSNNVELSGFYFRETWSTHLIKFNSVSNSLISNNFFDKIKGNPYSRVIGLQGESKGNTISYNTFDGIHTMGITISADNNFNNSILHNVFINIPSVKEAHHLAKDNNGMEVIAIGNVGYWEKHLYNKSFKTYIAYNYFENIKGDMNEIISVKANDNLIENNYFTLNSGGVSLRMGKDNVVRNNIFVKNSQNIIVTGEGHRIEQNIIIGDQRGIKIPAAHESNRNKKTGKFSGYYRAENIKIIDNIILIDNNLPLIVSEHFSNKRNLEPINITVNRNRFSISARTFYKYFKMFDKVNIVTSNIFDVVNYPLNKDKQNKFYYGGKKW